MTIKVP